MYTHQVACGHGFTLFLVEPDESRLSELSVFDPVVPTEKNAAENEGVQKKAEEVESKRPTRARNTRKKASRDEEDDERPAVKKRKPAAGRKRGRGRKRGQKRG